MSNLFILSILLLVSVKTYASGAGLTYQGRLVGPDGVPVNGNNIQFRMQIRTPGNENCLLYEEIQSKDMSNSNGVFALSVNDGSGTRQDSNPYPIDQIFANRGSMSFPAGYCISGSSYSPNASDGRRLQIYFNDGTFSGWEPVPSQSVTFIPMAIEALQVGGYKKEQLIRLADGVSTAGAELDAGSWAKFSALLTGSSAQYVKPTDPVNQILGATLPVPVNGQSLRWNSALNAGSGGWENFTAGAAAAVTNVSSANSDIGVASGASTPVLTLNSGTGANQIIKLDGTGKLPAVDGSALSAINASKILGTALNLASLTSGQILKYNGTNWINASDNDTLGGLSCASGQVAYYYTGAWTCLGASSANTTGALVVRDVGGNFDASQANLTGLKLNNGAGADVTLVSPATFTSYQLKLPTSAGANGQVLSTDGASPANLSWVSLPVLPTPGGANAQVQFNNSGVFGASANFNWDNTNSRLGIGTSAPGSSLDVKGTLRLSGATSGYVGFISQAAAGSTTYMLPSGDGTTGQVLSTNGSGQLSWLSPSTGSVTSVSSANSDIGVATGSSTPVLTLNSGFTGGGGDANKIAKLDAGGLIPTAMLPGLNASQITAGVLTIVRGGTNSSTALTNNQIMYSNGGGIKELGAMTDGQIVVGKNANAPQIVSITGDIGITNAGATTVGKINGTVVSGVGLANNNILQNNSGSVIAGNNVLVSNGTATGVTALSSPASGVLTSSANAPSWSASLGAAMGGTGQTSYTQGDLLYANSTTTLAKLPASTAGYVLTTNGAGTNPSWNPPTSSIALSSLTPATATNTIDSLNFAQTWNWSTATTQSSMSISANALTTGSLLSLTTSSASVNSSSGLLSIANTGASTSGTLARFQANSTAGSGMTILNSGNVGIGTTAPLWPMQLNAAPYGTMSAVLAVMDTSSYSAGAGGGLAFGGVIDGVGTTGSYGGIRGYKLNGTSGDYGGGLIFLSHPNGGNGTERMRITDTGSVGIGTNVPRGALDVNGTLLTKAASLNASGTIDFASGNIQYTNSSCGVFQLNNMKDGGSFTFVVKGTTSSVCSFTAYSDAGTTVITVHMPPDHTATTVGKHTVYSLMVAGADVYVAWMPSY